MKLPNAEQVVIDEGKLREYLLSKTHPVGRFKAGFFAGLGFGPEDWQLLRDRLRELALLEGTEAGEATEFGRKYLISGTLRGPEGASAEVLSVWFIPAEQGQSAACDRIS